MRLCLNMIVKNEASIITRCLTSVLPFISSWVIADTGSTDGTQQLILDFFRRHSVPGELIEFPFSNFGESRNRALDAATSSSFDFNYILLCDADMELVVENFDAFKNLTHKAYSLTQKSAITYQNIRLLRRDSGAKYIGVTHEYISVEDEGGVVEGIWYKDYASGSNRADKFLRDAKLLEDGLDGDPYNTRYMFYLAQSYRDAGDYVTARQWYNKRAKAGGWEEEAWYAQWQASTLANAIGEESSYVQESLDAFARRPHRAEPLYSLARHYRTRNQPLIGLIFANAASKISYPATDKLFIDEFLYRFGVMEELSIDANHSHIKDEFLIGLTSCDRLAYSRDTPEAVRHTALSNTRWYARPIEYYHSSATVCGSCNIESLPSIAFELASFSEQAARINYVFACFDAGLQKFKFTSATADLPKNTGMTSSGDVSYSDLEEITICSDIRNNKIVLRNHKFIPRLLSLNVDERHGDINVDIDPDDMQMLLECNQKSLLLINSLSPPKALSAPRSRVSLQSSFVGGDFLGVGSLISVNSQQLGLLTEEVSGLRHHRFFSLDSDGNFRLGAPFFVKEHGAEKTLGCSYSEASGLVHIIVKIDNSLIVTSLDQKDIQRDLQRSFTWEFNLKSRDKPTSWLPSAPLAGTELMVRTLTEFYPEIHSDIDLRINIFDGRRSGLRPVVVWIHHDINQSAVQWCRDARRIQDVDWFVFVSDWQMARFLSQFGIPKEKSVVLRNATFSPLFLPDNSSGSVVRVAYTSTPFRGLSLLLKAWERLGPSNVTLDLWSSMLLYKETEWEESFKDIYKLASTLPGVSYRGLLPNASLRAELCNIDIFAYPSTFEETSCLAAIEALCAGCLLVVPKLGALGEGYEKYCCFYDWSASEAEHIDRFSRVLSSAIERAQSRTDGERIRQVDDARSRFDWQIRLAEWRSFVKSKAQ